MTQTQPKHYSNKQLDIKLHEAPLCGPSRHISGSYTTVHYAKHISDLSSERKHRGVPQQPRLTQQLAAAASSSTAEGEDNNQQSRAKTDTAWPKHGRTFALTFAVLL